MATVGLTFTALPEHVRTARLVASAVARRLGLDDDMVDGVRLAVGEACARAVGRSRGAGTERPVEVELVDEPGRLVVKVVDHAPYDDPHDADTLSLTLIRGLAHEVAIESGGLVRLTWRTGGS